MTQLTTRFAAAVAFAIAATPLAAEVASGPASVAQQMPASACEFERDWLEVERGPQGGILLVMAQETLEICHERAFRAVITEAFDAAPAGCADQRAWLAAEASTPGILRMLALEAVQDCTAQQGGAMTTRATGR